jgi:hypothetical protein
MQSPMGENKLQCKENTSWPLWMENMRATQLHHHHQIVRSRDAVIAHTDRCSIKRFNNNPSFSSTFARMGSEEVFNSFRQKRNWKILN